MSVGRTRVQNTRAIRVVRQTSQLLALVQQVRLLHHKSGEFLPLQITISIDVNVFEQLEHVGSEVTLLWSLHHEVVLAVLVDEMLVDDEHELVQSERILTCEELLTYVGERYWVHLHHHGKGGLLALGADVGVLIHLVYLLHALHGGYGGRQLRIVLLLLLPELLGI